MIIGPRLARRSAITRSRRLLTVVVDLAKRLEASPPRGFSLSEWDHDASCTRAGRLRCRPDSQRSGRRARLLLFAAHEHRRHDRGAPLIKVIHRRYDHTIN
jgi:hypothetical protein